ncbi:hypothetical protein TNCV_5015051 [Trichonephila clavipes]|nr:hypothetical protein TNCV_5015051 [Trichonephila clavipes]
MLLEITGEIYNIKIFDKRGFFKKAKEGNGDPYQIVLFTLIDFFDLFSQTFYFETEMLIHFVAVTSATCLTMSDRSPRNSSRQRGRCMPVVSRSFDSRYALAGFHPNFEGKHSRGGLRPPTSLSLLPTPREDLQLDGYLEYSHAARPLYIYKHPCLLLNLKPGCNTQVSVANF